MKLITSLFIAALMFASCAEKSSEPEDKKTIPYINRIDPYPVMPSWEHTIYGQNFGNYKNGNSVLFDTVQIDNFQLWNDDKIVLTVPKKVKEGKITIIADSAASEGFPFKIGIIPEEIKRKTFKNIISSHTKVRITWSNPFKGDTIETMEYPNLYIPVFIVDTSNYIIKEFRINESFHTWFQEMGDVCAGRITEHFYYPYLRNITLTEFTQNSLVFEKKGALGILMHVWDGWRVAVHNSGKTCERDNYGDSYQLNGFIRIEFIKE